MHVLRLLCLFQHKLLSLLQLLLNLLKEQTRRNILCLPHLLNRVHEHINVIRLLHHYIVPLALRDQERYPLICVFTSLDQRCKSKCEHLLVLIEVDEVHRFDHAELVQDVPCVVLGHGDLV